MFSFLKKKKVVTRFAPSPTGVLHIGGVRTALFNYLFAKKYGGKFIIRIEDTDKERSKKEYEDGIMEAFKWLGLTHDEFYRQSDRGDVYKKYLQQLIDQGAAYQAEQNNDGTGSVVRFKNPNKDITFKDEIIGEVTFNTEELGDFVIARDLNSPVYHFVVVVDDGEMNITHVIRGQEHLNSTARQIVILEALGFKRPVYAHIPLIMSPNGGKLSKRDPGVMSVMEYKEAGYLKDALLNFLAFIGWNPGDDREIMSLAELTKEFSLEKVQKSGGSFNTKKLIWINKQYIKNASNEEKLGFLKEFLSEGLCSKISSHEKAIQIAGMLTERIDTLSELSEKEKKREFDFLFNHPSYDKDALVPKKAHKSETLTHLKHAKEIFSNISDWDEEVIKNSIWDYATEHGRANVLWPLRYALTGMERSPDPFAVAEVIGKVSTEERIEKAIDMLS
jgi:glutamyl-tRNA synthetase